MAKKGKMYFRESFDKKFPWRQIVKVLSDVKLNEKMKKSLKYLYINYHIEII